VNAIQLCSGLLSERQCTARNARRDTRQRVSKPRIPRHRLGTTSAKSQLMTAVMSLVDPVTPGSTSSIDRQSPHCRSPLDQLSDDHRELLTRIIGYQDKYELPTPENIQSVTVGFSSSYRILYWLRSTVYR